MKYTELVPIINAMNPAGSRVEAGQEPTGDDQCLHLHQVVLFELKQKMERIQLSKRAIEAASWVEMLQLNLPNLPRVFRVSWEVWAQLTDGTLSLKFEKPLMLEVSKLGTTCWHSL